MADLSRIADEEKFNAQMTKAINDSVKEHTMPKLSRKYWYITEEREKEIDGNSN